MIKLEFMLNKDKKSYAIFNCMAITGFNILPTMHEGLPITTIKKAAFLDGDWLGRGKNVTTSPASVLIGDNITTIEKNAFGGSLKVYVKMSEPLEGWDKEWHHYEYSKSREHGGDTAPRFGVNEDNLVNKFGFDFLIEGKNAILINYGITFKTAEIPENITITKSTRNKKDELITTKTTYTVTEIGEWAFANNNKIREVLIPKTIKRIGSNAFKDAENLEKVVFSDGLEIIENKAFYCTKKYRGGQLETGVPMGDIVLPSTLKIVGDRAFYGREIESLVLNKGLTQIGEKAFNDFRDRSFSRSYSKTEFIVPSTVKKIGKEAFKHLWPSGEYKLVIEDGVEEVGEKAFGWLKREMTVYLPKSVKKLGHEAFGKAHIINEGDIELLDFWGREMSILKANAGTSLKIYDLQFEISGDTAVFVKLLKRNNCLSIPHLIKDEKDNEYRVIKVKSGAVEFASTVILSDGIEEIEPDGIKYYQTLFLPKSLKSLEQKQLEKSVVIHLYNKANELAIDTSSLGDLFELDNLFGDEPKFKARCAFYEIDDNNFVLQDDLCYYIDSGEAIVTACIADGGNVKIPHIITIKGKTYPVTKIGRFAFKNSCITKIDAPSIKEIGLHAFLRCDKLKEIVMDGAEKIAREAFCECTNLVTVSIKNIKTIEERAFLKCSKLENINFDKTAKIAPDAFEWCFKIKKQ